MFHFPQKTSFGLDLSDLSFKIVQFKKKKDDLYLSSFIKQDIPRGLVEEGEIKKEKELIDIFKKTLIKMKLGNRVICNLPEEKVFIRIVQLPKMEESELEKAIIWEAEANIPLNISEAYIGWQVIDPIFEHIDHLDILIAATPRILVDNYLSFLRKSGLEPIALEPESASVVRSIMTKDDLTPSIIVDLGAVGTNFVIFSALAIRFTSHINISGQLFNHAIMKELKVSEKEADKLKINVGLDKKKEKGMVYDALEPIIDDLAKQINNYIIFYHEHANHIHGPYGTIGQIILSGGDSLLLNLPEVLSEKLKLPVKMGDSLANVSSKGIPFSKKESFKYATAIGLALKGFL